MWPFGKLSEAKKSSFDVGRFAWLWTQRSQLQVVKTPFWQGRHEAKRPEEFLPIIKELEELHAQGFVHGDIRCFNILFDGGNGKLIDFDYSGKAGVTFYPDGFKWSLPDGFRPPTEGQVEKWHDWYALCYIICSLHLIGPPGKWEYGEVDSIFLKQFAFKRSLREMSSNEEAAVFVENLTGWLCACQDAGCICESIYELKAAIKQGPAGSRV
jgi:serine/threonine protein kinase